MKPTFDEVDAAVTTMAELNLSGFPTGPAGRSLLMSFLWNMVSNTDQLHWLLEAMPQMRKFSMPELRGIFCTRFQPADGVEGVALETPGFHPDDVERRAHDLEATESRRNLAAWKQDLKLLGEPEGPEPLPLENANKIPKPTLREISRAEHKAQLRDAEKTLEEQKARMRRRTPEENARLIRDLEEKLRIKKG